MDKEISRAELIKELSERMMLRERQCLRVFNFIMSEIEKTIEQGDRFEIDRKSTRLNSSHVRTSRMPSSA